MHPMKRAQRWSHSPPPQPVIPDNSEAVILPVTASTLRLSFENVSNAVQCLGVHGPYLSGKREGAFAEVIPRVYVVASPHNSCRYFTNCHV